MKKLYEKPDVELVEVAVQDILTTGVGDPVEGSGFVTDNWDSL